MSDKNIILSLNKLLFALLYHIIIVRSCRRAALCVCYYCEKQSLHIIIFYYNIYCLQTLYDTIAYIILYRRDNIIIIFRSSAAVAGWGNGVIYNEIRGDSNIWNIIIAWRKKTSFCGKILGFSGVTFREKISNNNQCAI